MKKIEMLPIGPLSRITHKIECLKTSDIDSSKKLAEIVDLLDRKECPSLNELSWADYYLLLRPFVSDGFENRMIRLPPGEPEYERLEKSKPFYGALGLAAFADILEQAKAWQSTVDPSGRVDECRFWMQVLYDEKIDARLCKISRADSNAVKTTDYRKWTARYKATVRQRKSRAAIGPKKLRKKP